MEMRLFAKQFAIVEAALLQWIMQKPSKIAHLQQVLYGLYLWQ